MWRRGRSYVLDLRSRVLAAVDGGMAVREAAPLFRVSVSYIYKALIRRRATGDSSANPNRGHRPRKLSPRQEAALAARIRSEPDITLARLASRSARGMAEQWRHLDGSEAARLHLQKKRSRRASRSGRTWPRAGLGGTRPGRSLIPSAWCSSTKPASIPK